MRTVKRSEAMNKRDTIKRVDWYGRNSVHVIVDYK